MRLSRTTKERRSRYGYKFTLSYLNGKTVIVGGEMKRFNFKKELKTRGE